MEECDVCHNGMELVRGGDYFLRLCKECGNRYERFFQGDEVKFYFGLPPLTKELLMILTGKAIMSLRVKELIKKMEEKPP